MKTMLASLTRLNRLGIFLLILSVSTVVMMFIPCGILGLLWVLYQQGTLTGEMLLPDGVTPATTVSELQQMEQEFLGQKSLGFMANLSLATVIQLSICWMLVRIGLCWKRNEAFGQRVIQSLFVIGLISVFHGLYGFVAGCFMDASLGGQVLLHSYLYDLIMVGSQSGMVGSLTTGLLFIALSQVLKQGQVLKTEQELTV
ncbi:MAG: DUF2975 domain-containing protein [Verrucomicrobiota bacterium]